MEYVFIFGRDPELSYLELVSYLDARNIGYNIRECSNMAAVVEMGDLDFEALIAKLGGCIKIGRILGKDEQLYSGSCKKIKYAISRYDGSVEGLRDFVKKQMKAEKLKAMEKCSKRKLPFLSPTEVMRFDLMDAGFELINYKNYVAKTIAVFNPKEIEKRDNERPCQRHKHMTSIRLAKILINIAGAVEHDTLLDPFCGYGSILQEAMLLDLNVIGIDNSNDCVKASLRNLNWIKKRYNVKKKFKVMKGDSTKLSKYVKKADCVATEPFLGPLIKKLPTKAAAIRTIKELTPIYNQLLNELKKVVKKNIVIIVPRFRLHTNERITMDFEEMARKAGLKVTLKINKVEFPIIYTAPNSKIEREIWLLSND